MRFPRLPRLPVSRRRHDELAELVCAYNRIASEDLAEYKRRARKAEARVAELEQAIRTVLQDEETGAGGWGPDVTMASVLREVLDGHEETPAERWQSPDEAGADARAHHRQERGDEPVTYQDGRRYRLVQDGVATGGNLPRRGYSSGTTTPVSEWRDPREPRTGRWTRRQRARDWLTGGSFKGVRRER